tara:strand:- start:27 stop:461 length:435 start_codon:yes stop_codon:yes gene_type:complete
MKVYRYILISILGLSFLFSQLGKVPSKKNNSSPVISKKGEVIKSDENDNLKSELIELENRFKDDHESIKVKYRERIKALKENQKAEVQSLKKQYNQRRKAIYRKYGIKPPKKDSNIDEDTYRAPKKLDDTRKSPLGKSKSPTRK